MPSPPPAGSPSSASGRLPHRRCKGSHGRMAGAARPIHSICTRPDKPRSSRICLRSASKLRETPFSTVTENAIPILRSAPLRSFGRTFVPRRFQISGGTSPVMQKVLAAVIGADSGSGSEPCSGTVFHPRAPSLASSRRSLPDSSGPLWSPPLCRRHILAIRLAPRQLMGFSVWKGAGRKACPLLSPLQQIRLFWPDRAPDLITKIIPDKIILSALYFLPLGIRPPFQARQFAHLAQIRQRSLKGGVTHPRAGLPQVGDFESFG